MATGEILRKQNIFLKALEGYYTNSITSTDNPKLLKVSLVSYKIFIKFNL